MPIEISPRKLQKAVKAGFERLKNFRAARLLFLRNYVGQYYDQDKGEIGSEPLNRIFETISVLVPNLVMNYPKHVVSSRFLAYRDYADLLKLALDVNAKQINLKDTIRRLVVDSLFCIGILKTGLCSSDSAVEFEGYGAIDAGTIYTELVDIDDFVFDPSCRRDFNEGSFLGDRVRVSRQLLLDSGLYANDIIEKLPTCDYKDDDRAEQLSMNELNPSDRELYDEVEVIELWIPKAQALITIPSGDYEADEFLRVTDYYGPKTGPYTFLRLTPPVPNNPMPVAPAGIWNDLHVLTNRMAKKITEQADRQKDILGYQRAAADDAQEVLDSQDGDAVAMENPEGVRTFSFGGQQRSNEAHLAQLDLWYNRISGNIEALGGLQSNADTATQAQLLNANGSIRIEDIRDLVYAAVGQEAEKRAFYLHNDPLIKLPLIRRQQKPAQFTITPMGPLMVSPATSEEVQVMLTPEARRGDFLDYNITIEMKSMSRLDPAMRLQRAMDFAVKVLPSAATAAQVCMQMGVPFSFPAFVIRMAKELEIEWLDEVFLDPNFQLHMAQLMMQLPMLQNSKAQAGPSPAPTMQPNGQPRTVMNTEAPNVQSTIQTGLAGEAQGNLPNRGGY